MNAWKNSIKLCIIFISSLCLTFVLYMRDGKKVMHHIFFLQLTVLIEVLYTLVKFQVPILSKPLRNFDNFSCTSLAD